MVEEGCSNKPSIGLGATLLAPLFCVVGGSSKKILNAGADFSKACPDKSKTVLKSLTKIVVEHVAAQVEKGTQLLQFFEVMGMAIDEDAFL